MRLSEWLAATAALVVATAAGQALARPLKARHRVHAATTASRSVAPLSEDALELGYLAPPTRLTTLRQDYGDAAIARLHFERRYLAELKADRRQEADGRAPYPCNPRDAGPDAYICRGDNHHLGYGQYYVFTPSYVSSPQVVGENPNLQDEILPPTTAVFWAVNGLRYDPHN